MRGLPGVTVSERDGNEWSGEVLFIDDVARILDAKRINQKVTAEVLRGGEKHEFTLVPEERN